MSQAERKEAVNEIRILASVEHTNVIRFCEAFVLDDQLYIITEFANHGDLFQKLQRWCVIPTFPRDSRYSRQWCEAGHFDTWRVLWLATR